jgi:hypothetical protein
MPTIKCFTCGKEVFKKPYLIRRAEKHFCSSHCRGLYYSVGNRHPSWKGGKYKKEGYVYVWAPDHPYTNARGYVAEHRLVMEQKIGRFLKPEETPHHIDGDHGNNSPDNLMLFENHSEHRKYESKIFHASKYAHLACDHCGKHFDRLKSQMKEGKQYCSWECKSAAYVPPLRNRVTVACPICSKKFRRTAKRIIPGVSCCSHTCATTLMNRNLAQRKQQQV